MPLAFLRRMFDGSIDNVGKCFISSVNIYFLAKKIGKADVFHKPAALYEKGISKLSAVDTKKDCIVLI
ncbi:hypothetical protein [Clostridium aceticum]|uniref:hypothetical protein n=1 Tax=Clostridium aceticum TaxID=84022 RepID=UPI0005CE818F|nr:hypothetical protein [Clostridium aceticum]KJF27381.1 hypothetical protein TZ02_08580 [Clostridium aceticum]